ncbi:hypothetical protein V8E36_004224 [Tilletia maclaganii]
MSFQFSFGSGDDLEMEDDAAASTQQEQEGQSTHNFNHTHQQQQQPLSAKEWSLASLLETLPPSLSYSPISIPLDPIPSSSTPPKLLHLARRDLFDARFQMLHDDDNDEPGADVEEDQHTDPNSKSAAVGADSDLVPGVYEGGLKTWECALDLIAELHSRTVSPSGSVVAGSQLQLRGKKIIELGCGTALPSLFVLAQLLSGEDDSNGAGSELHLADFNPEVLRLVTVPNLIITWYFFSPAAASFRTDPGHTNEAQKSEPLSRPPQQQQPSPNQPGELVLSSALLTAFLDDLQAHSIHIRLFSGPWSELSPILFNNDTSSAAPYDLTLTSETVYSLDTLPSLVDLLYLCSRGGRGAGTPSSAQPSTDSATASSSAATSPPLCLVAAKVLYFGVGGGVHSFVQAVTNDLPAQSQSGFSSRPPGSCQLVREIRAGVGRAVLQASW